MRLSSDDIQALIAALEETSYGELRLETGSYSLFLRRTGGAWSVDATVLKAAAAASDETEAGNETAGDSPIIRSPLAGIFYRAPKPGTPPFVEVGSIVTPDTVIGITETMKLMNSVHAGVSGRITQIAVGDASFVEAGQVLMHIEETAQ
jgi:acetyl-CoA carboxylase biotin carboxyl carrier protein